MDEVEFMTEIARSVLQPPGPGAHRIMASASLRAAIQALREGDTAAARAFIEDALAHVRAIRGE